MCVRERERDRASSCNLILMVCIDFIGGKDAGEMRMSFENVQSPRQVIVLFMAVASW